MNFGRTYVIAEAGVNHDGRVEDALALVDAAADAGADCVKFQTFRADALASSQARKADYQKRTTESEESQLSMLRRLELPLDAYGRLIARAHEREIAFLSTPFDHESLRFLLKELRLGQIKIGSGDLTNAPLLLEAAQSGCPLILSTGMATLAEVEEALSVLAFGYGEYVEEPSRYAFSRNWNEIESRAVLKDKVVLLHCTTEYPAPPESTNLRAIDTIAAAFGLPVGYSDHTLGYNASLAAVARGAVMIEKHLTLDTKRPGPDHAASLDPHQFKDLVKGIRSVEALLGDGLKMPQQAEIKNISIARKAVVAARPIARGELITKESITVKRPAQGLAPILFWDVLGHPARRDYQIDEFIDP